MHNAAPFTPVLSSSVPTEVHTGGMRRLATSLEAKHVAEW